MRRDVLEIQSRLFDIFLVHTETGHCIQQCTNEQIWEIKNGMEEIRRSLVQYAPVDNIRSSLLLLDEFINVCSLATMPLMFGREKLSYPCRIYSLLIQAAMLAGKLETPEWILDKLAGNHIIYNESGYIIGAKGSMGGYAAEEVVGKHFTEFIIPEQIPKASKQLVNLFKGKRGSHSYLLRQKDGTTNWHTIHCHPYLTRDKLTVLSAIQDGYSKDYIEECAP
ncbi:MAG: PAS domain-containing protein [Syntrophaceae bacterium]